MKNTIRLGCIIACVLAVGAGAAVVAAAPDAISMTPSDTNKAFGSISNTHRFESSYALSGSNSKFAAVGLAFVAVPPPAGSPVLLESWRFNETPGGQELQALSNSVGTASWSSANEIPDYRCGSFIRGCIRRKRRVRFSRLNSE